MIKQISFEPNGRVAIDLIKSDGDLHRITFDVESDREAVIEQNNAFLGAPFADLESVAAILALTSAHWTPEVRAVRSAELEESERYARMVAERIAKDEADKKAAFDAAVAAAVAAQLSKE